MLCQKKDNKVFKSSTFARVIFTFKKMAMNFINLSNLLSFSPLNGVLRPKYDTKSFN